MQDRTLARWTLSWFAVALLLLLAALAGAVAGWGGPGNWRGGEGLALVHLFVLGWLGLVMCGALLQFVPVLAARGLFLPVLALPALVLCLSGLFLLVAGFLGLADGTMAPLALGAGFGLVALMVSRPVLRPRGPGNGAGRMVLAALAGLALVWLSGATLLGWGTGLRPLGDLLPLHMLAGLGAWFGLAALGVSYKLFPMFLLAPETPGRLRHATLGLAVVSVAALLAALAGLPVGPGWALAGFGLTAVLYLADIAGVWRARRRPKPEANMRWSRIALVLLALALVLAVPALLRGGVWAEAAVLVAAAGWLSVLTLAQLVKIVSFLTWVQVFGPRVGRARVPMVQDLTAGIWLDRWLWLWLLGLGLATLAVLAGSAVLFRLAGAPMLLAALGLIHEVVAIRRLHHVPRALRPERLPPIILPLFRPDATP